MCTGAIAGNVSDQFHRAKQILAFRKCEGGSRENNSLSFPLTCSLKSSLVPVPLESKNRTKILKKRKELGQRLGVTMKQMGLEVFYKGV